MKNIIPVPAYEEIPCTVVACGCALDYFRKAPAGSSKFDALRAAMELQYHDDGYLSLQGTNKLVRSLFEVPRGGYRYYKRNERKQLFQCDFDGKNAIVMVLGHCIFVTGDGYYSFFDNHSDDVVAVWIVEDEIRNAI